MMEPWRENWREFAPELPTEGLQALADALKSNDERLQPGNYFESPDGIGVVAACAIGYVVWQNYVGENVLDLMHRLKVKRMRGMRIHRFTEWFDANSPYCHAELLPEVNRELARRHAVKELGHDSAVAVCPVVSAGSGRNGARGRNPVSVG